MSTWSALPEGNAEPPELGETSVARAAERMLTGGAADMLIEARDLRSPAWTYVNRLAHSGPADLWAYANTHTADGWSAAVSLLAADMLAAEGPECELEWLQREVLVPMELDMLGGGSQPANPADLVAFVASGIDRHRSRHS